MKNSGFIAAIVVLFVFIAAPVWAQIDQFEPPQKLPDAINSNVAEESLPLVSKDGNTLFFVRTFHPDNTGEGQDIWMSTKNDDGTWTTATNSLGSVNTKVNNAIAGISTDGNTIYLVNTYQGKTQSGIGLSKATRSGSSWSKPEEVQVPGLNPMNQFYSIFVAPEEDVLIISMQDQFSQGQNDLYLSTKNDQDEWSVLQNMGERINSAGDEISPYLSPDRTKLYFSTNGRGGMGGYDIFVSERQGDSWNDWGIPVNLPDGINSPAFDAYFSVYEDSTVYFSSSRNDTIASLYISRIIDPTKDGEDDDDALDELAIENGDTDPLIDDSIVVVGTDNDQIDPRDQIEKGQALDNILYDYDKHFLREESKRALDVVVDALNKDTDLQVRLVGHCDNRGSQEYNLPLSHRRANSAREYIESKGIASNRIDTDGKGKRQPAASNDTDEGRQLNRRVEIYFK